MEIKFIELFAGIGGFRYGLERANNIITQSENRESKEGWNGKTDVRQTLLHGRSISSFTCIWSNEWDKYACQIYRKNFGNKELHEGDITTIDAGSIPDHDLLCGGFPCQAFSIAGKRKGFEDTRGTLFFDIARILNTKRPRMLLLENVKGLLSHDNGDTFRTILWVLHELGYDVQWQVLNSKDFGVPQNRERVFIIGHLRGTHRPEVFPIRAADQEINKGIVSTAIDGNYWKGPDKHGQRTMIIFGDGHKNNTPTDIVPTLRAGRKFDMDKIRRLTPTECERLQGFPDGWTEGVSDTQRYKCLGNAVTTNVITEIGKRLTNGWGAVGMWTRRKIY